jgi:hypothetical protein
MSSNAVANRAANHLRDDSEDGSQVAQVPASFAAAEATAAFAAHTRVATTELFLQCRAENEPDNNPQDV